MSLINAKLAAGLHEVLSPGVYRVRGPIRIGRRASANQVLLRLGLPTLVPTEGKPAVVVEVSHAHYDGSGPL